MNPPDINHQSPYENLMDTAQKEEISHHSQSYSDLLSIYVNSIKDNTKMKYGLKISFFIITMGILIIIVAYSGFSLFYVSRKLNSFNNLNELSIEAILGILTIVLPVISSLIVAFIEIPKIIAQYLFNIEEERYVNSIIKNIQDYDRSIFGMEYKLQEVLKNTKIESSDRLDDSIEESPDIIENNDESSLSDGRNAV